MFKNKTLSNVPIILLGAALCMALGVFAWAGSYARMWADDYCYSAVAQEYEVLPGMLHWYQNHGNRFSAMLGVELTDRFGPYITAWLPSLVIVAWVLAAWFMFQQIARRVQPDAGLSRWAWLPALALVFFSVLMFPSLQESLYWRMGMLHYTLPLLFFTAAVGALSAVWPSGQPRSQHWAAGALLAGLAFVAAGFSETYAALQAGALMLAAMALLWRRAPAGLALLIPALLATLGAMAAMALSPANAWRQELMPPPSSLLDLVLYTLRYTRDFYFATLTSLPLPSLAFGLMACVFGVELYPQLSRPPRAGRLAKAALVSLPVGFALVASAIAPSAYAGLQYPAERALSVALFGLLLGLGATLLLGGSWLRAVLHGNAAAWRLASAVLLLGLAAYVPTTLDYPLYEVQGLQRRAVRWDARHAYILEARQDGLQQVSVQDVVIVSGLEDLRRSPEHWVNSCVARYYDLQSIVETP